MPSHSESAHVHRKLGHGHGRGRGDGWGLGRDVGGVWGGRWVWPGEGGKEWKR